MTDIKVINNKYELPTIIKKDTILMNSSNIDLNLLEMYSDIASFDNIIQGNSLKELKKVAENCNCLGALLSFDKNKNVYTIWNGNKSNYDYWDPCGKDNSIPSTKYGNVIAVCAGKGKWIVLNWYGMNGNEITLNINGNDCTMRQGYMCWAHRDTILYNTYFYKLLRSDGYNNTKYIFENYGKYISDYSRDKIEENSVFSNWDEYYNALPSIWAQLTSSNIVGLNDWKLDDKGVITQYGNMYIPSATELREALVNCLDNSENDLYEDAPRVSYESNIGQLLGLVDPCFWSSSQDIWDYCNAFIVNSDGYVENYNKNDYYLSLVFLHF